MTTTPTTAATNTDMDNMEVEFAALTELAQRIIIWLVTFLHEHGHGPLWREGREALGLPPPPPVSEYAAWRAAGGQWDRGSFSDWLTRHPGGSRRTYESRQWWYWSNSVAAPDHFAVTVRQLRGTWVEFTKAERSLRLGPKAEQWLECNGNGGAPPQLAPKRVRVDGPLRRPRVSG